MKTRLFSALLVLALALAVLPGAAWAAGGQTVVYASTAEELKAALKSDTHIILEGKDYNVGHEGLSLSFLNNVTIQGTAGTRIIGEEYLNSDPRYNGAAKYGMIFYIDNSTNILLQNLSIGYTSPPDEALGLRKPLWRKGFKDFKLALNAHLPRICPFQREFFVNL